LKVIPVFILGVVIGAIATQAVNSLSFDFIGIRIIDNQNCKAPVYTIEMEDKSIVIAGKQVNFEFTPMATTTDTDIQIYPSLKSGSNINYTVRASYDDCETILSDVRQVERGWLIYESISDGNIKHQVRAK